MELGIELPIDVCRYGYGAMYPLRCVGMGIELQAKLKSLGNETFFLPL